MDILESSNRAAAAASTMRQSSDRKPSTPATNSTVTNVTNHHHQQPNQTSPQPTTTSNNSTNTTRIGGHAKATHVCSVCGDRAFYVFYGALACDSCRTFFRRQTLSCHFKNNCDIQLNTRKDCAKCRLDKCLRVGMKQNLVAVNEVDTTAVSNSSNHGPSPTTTGQTNNHTMPPPTSITPPTSSGPSHLSISKSPVNHRRKGSSGRLSPPLPNFVRVESPSTLPAPPPAVAAVVHPLYLGPYRAASHSLPSIHLSPTGSSSGGSSSASSAISVSRMTESPNTLLSESLQRFRVNEFTAQPNSEYLLQVRRQDWHHSTSSLPDTDSNSHHQHITQQYQEKQKDENYHSNNQALMRYRKTPGTPYRLAHPTMGPISIESLNAKEKEKVFEVELAMAVLNERSSDIDLNGDARPLHDFLNLIYMATSKLIKATRQYTILSELPTSDQMHLLKGAVSEMLFLWSVFALDVDKKAWLLPCIESKDGDKMQTLSIEVLKAANDNLELYTKYESFVNSFDTKYRKDKFLMNLLFVICLFNAERDSLIEKDMIRYERRLYSSLFRRYLVAAYGESEASGAYTTLIGKLEELSTLKQLYERTSVDIEDVNLLVKPTNSLLIN